MRYARQFTDKEDIVPGSSSPVYDPDFYEVCENFDGSPLLSLGEMVNKLSSGQFVEILPDGVTGDDQIFTDVMMDNFEAMDAVDRIGRIKDPGLAQQKVDQAAPSLEDAPIADDPVS